ncbi:MAG: biotin synthase BioB [Desulfobulbaceae bacterium]|nr:biotin synthase BioB [Desulfobulbaceae bacterium]
MILSPAEIGSLRTLPCRELMARALQTKLARRGKSLSLCAIINAKSGQCSEDCRFCAQSSHFKTDTPVYPLKPAAEIVAAARQARENGASHFSIVTSGRAITARSLPALTAIIAAIKDQVDIAVCASLGIATVEDLQALKQAGLSRYHHNLETSREFFPRIVTTHTFDERIATIEAARQAGLEVCAGGIIGLGESEADRISLALALAELRVKSVPLNILIPLAGTPLAQSKPLAIEEILRAIALFRLILPDAALRLAAGRESALHDFLSSAFMAGADGMMIGGYLTQRGRSAEMDRQFVQAIRDLWQ